MRQDGIQFHQDHQEQHKTSHARRLLGVKSGGAYSVLGVCEILAPTVPRMVITAPVDSGGMDYMGI